MEFKTFELKRGQTVQYRGNYGSPLGYFAAGGIVRALLDDPTISDEQLAKDFTSDYRAEEPLDGPGGFGPNIYLAGDDRLPCFILNMNTRCFKRLGSGWKSNLGAVCREIGEASGGPFWLNLLCCTNLEDVEVPKLDAKFKLVDWEDVLG